mmetsp:Transcript_8689/g.29841  ORF Transcript_8689/g.29841 Transcript_8689/m.29841 type:complete len:370 (-) Transcript_8689:1661-2770(-)
MQMVPIPLTPPPSKDRTLRGRSPLILGDWLKICLRHEVKSRPIRAAASGTPFGLANTSKSRAWPLSLTLYSESMSTVATDSEEDKISSRSAEDGMTYDGISVWWAKFRFGWIIWQHGPGHTKITAAAPARPASQTSRHDWRTMAACSAKVSAGGTRTTLPSKRAPLSSGKARSSPLPAHPGPQDPTFSGSKSFLESLGRAQTTGTPPRGCSGASLPPLIGSLVCRVFTANCPPPLRAKMALTRGAPISAAWSMSTASLLSVLRSPDMAASSQHLSRLTEAAITPPLRWTSASSLGWARDEYSISNGDPPVAQALALFFLLLLFLFLFLLLLLLLLFVRRSWTGALASPPRAREASSHRLEDNEAWWGGP